MITCEFCNKTFTTKYTMLHHQKTTKYCVKIQNNNKEKQNKQEKEQEQYRELQIKYKELQIEYKNIRKKYEQQQKESKEKYEQQQKESKEKYEQQQKESKEKYEQLQKESNEKYEQLQKESNEKYEQLQKESNEKYEQLQKENREQYEFIKELAKQPKNTNTNITTNTQNIVNLTCLDINEDKVTRTINESLTTNHFMEGQKGLANFAVEHLLTDEEGKILYACTDSSRNIYKYKDINGEIVKDCQAYKLIRIMKPGLKEKTPKLCKELEKNNPEICNSIWHNAISINNLDENSNEFTKQLTILTTN
jgi:hypothetical protein